LSYKIDDRDLRAAGIVQVGEAVAEAGTEMEQSACRLLRHSRIAVGSSGDDSFKQAQEATHLGDSVKSGDDMYF
jgi:hypothetical protein